LTGMCPMYFETRMSAHISSEYFPFGMICAAGGDMMMVGCPSHPHAFPYALRISFFRIYRFSTETW